MRITIIIIIVIIIGKIMRLPFYGRQLAKRYTGVNLATALWHGRYYYPCFKDDGMETKVD